MANNSNWMPRSAFLQLNRKHVTMPQHWAFEAGTDFWLIPGPDILTAEDTGSQQQIIEWGWTGTANVETVGAGAGFMDSLDRAPNHILTDGSGDILGTPAIFGDYDHARMAQDISGMGKLPTDLIVEFNGNMTSNGSDEPTSGWGFFEDGATISTEADQLAFISSDSSNFQLAANAGAGALTDTGAAHDTNWHLFKIRLNLADNLAYWYIDGTLQGSVALTDDEAPYQFGMHAATNNRPGLGIVHIYYDW